ncbi:hypothetical protein GCM10027454_03490 [Algoriphagus aestuariicola]|jgi:hypothetical protein
MALHLVACTYYGCIQLTAEDLVENNPIQEFLEKEVKMLHDYMIPSFSLEHPFLKADSTFYFAKNSNGFSSYVQEIHVPPPNFFQVIS